MNDSDSYLLQILQKYQARSLENYSSSILQLKSSIQVWAGQCLIQIIDSGSRAKRTAIALASDVDYLVSLSNGCNQSQGGLEFTYNQLFQHLKNIGYTNVRKQNVSSRITLNTLEIDITPATKLSGNTSDHSIWKSKSQTWQKTNIQRHISDISQSGRTDEIKLIKIWRELNGFDFPSIYMEYLLIDVILLYKARGVDNLSSNISYSLSELAKDNGNPLFSRIVDPSNTSNILSDLLDSAEKQKIINAAKIALKLNWGQVFY